MESDYTCTFNDIKNANAHTHTDAYSTKSTFKRCVEKLRLALLRFHIIWRTSWPYVLWMRDNVPIAECNNQIHNYMQPSEISFAYHSWLDCVCVCAVIIKAHSLQAIILNHVYETVILCIWTGIEQKIPNHREYTHLLCHAIHFHLYSISFAINSAIHNARMVKEKCMSSVAYQRKRRY